MGSENTGARQRVNYAIYFTGQDVVDLLVPADQRAKTLDFFEPLHPSKYYLECSKIDEDIRTEALRSIKADLTARGITASGALVPIHESRPLCYSDPEDMKFLEAKVRHIAEAFEEIIVDDWLFTVCACPRCVEARGSRSWAEFRQPLLVEAARNHILAAARAANPGACVIVKYPNWVEGHHHNGYDVVRQAAQFDAFCVGIETRHHEVQDQHFPIYWGYLVLRWFDLLDPARKTGSWLDNHMMQGQDDDYLAQVVQAVLGDSREVILWSAGWHYRVEKTGNAFPTLLAAKDRLDRLESLLGPAPRGIPTYLPFGSDGEYNIAGYLGMLGLPIQPVAEFPEGPEPAIFTRHAKADPELVERILEKLQAGADVLLTWPLLREMLDTELGRIFQIVDTHGSISSDKFHHHVQYQPQLRPRAERPISFPRIQTTTWPYSRRVAAVREDGDFMVLGSAKYLNGTVYLLNIPDNAFDLFHLPTESLDLIRRVFAPHLGVTLSATARVAHYLYGEALHVLHNQQAARASVVLTFPESGARAWGELLTGRSIGVGQKNVERRFGWRPTDIEQVVVQEVRLTLDPWEVAVIG